jgi:hypothetical protein
MKLITQMMPTQVDAKNVESRETEGPPFELPEDTWSERAEPDDNHAAREERVEVREQDSETRSERRQDEERSDPEDRHEGFKDEHLREERDLEDTPLFAHGVVREEKRPTRLRREVERHDVGPLLSQDLEDRRVVDRRPELATRERPVTRQVDEEVAPRLSTRQEPKVAREVLKQTDVAPQEKTGRSLERPVQDRIAGSKLEGVDRQPKVESPAKTNPRSAAIDKLAQMRAVARSSSRGKGISIARDLLQNVREARLDENRAVDRVARAAGRGEAVRSAVTENVAQEVHNVFKKASNKSTERSETARDSRRAAKDGDETSGDKFALGSTPSSTTPSSQAPVTATQTVTPVSAPASASAMNTTSTMGLDPEVSEALRNVRIEDPGDTVLRLNETDAGRLEVRIRSSGDDLMVLVKAEEQSLRQKMIDGLPELRKALDRAQLVAGRVDVAEFGAFENEARGDGDDQSFFESAFEDSLDQQESDDGESNPRGPGQPSPEMTSSNGAPASGSQRTDDGRLHVIV